MTEIKCKVTDIEEIGLSYKRVGLKFYCAGCDKLHDLSRQYYCELRNKKSNVNKAVFNKIHFGYYNPYKTVKGKP